MKTTFLKIHCEISQNRSLSTSRYFRLFFPFNQKFARSCVFLDHELQFYLVSNMAFLQLESLLLSVSESSIQLTWMESMTIVRGFVLEDWLWNDTEWISQYVSIFFFFSLRSIKLVLLNLVYLLIMNFDLIWFSNLAFLQLELLLRSVSEFSF